MLTAPKYKWIASLILGGILIFLAMIGGEWQATYAADAGINQVPSIDYISPVQVPAGSGNKTMVIGGADFGGSEDFIRVWIRDATHDEMLPPETVIDTGISVVISNALLVNPTMYSITVVKSNGQSIPPNPPNPVYDLVSNSKDFLVYETQYIYLPVIRK